MTLVWPSGVASITLPPERAWATARTRAVSRVVSEEANGVVLTLEAPAPSWGEGSGYVYPAIEGFGTLNEPDRPALPVRVIRVGIPAGSEPRLTILDAASTEHPSALVGPVQRWVPLLPGDDQRVPVGTEDPAVYGTAGFFPASEPVRLGIVGSLREQPFVEIVYTPVLHDPARRLSVVYSRVTVRVDFGPGVSPAAIAPAGAAGASEEPDPAFGSLYEEELANPAQAKAFRAVQHADAPAADPVEPTHEGASTLTPISTRYKMIVNKTGMYRLSAAWATSNAPTVNRPVSSLRSTPGHQLPITVIDANSDGNFGSDLVSSGQALTGTSCLRTSGARGTSPTTTSTGSTPLGPGLPDVRDVRRAHSPPDDLRRRRIPDQRASCSGPADTSTTGTRTTCSRRGPTRAGPSSWPRREPRPTRG